MARFGINVDNALGISVKTLRRLAKDIGPDHELALALWQSGIHEARILASIVADPNLFKAQHARAWVKDFNSWGLCDQCCQNLFWQIDGARELALSWVANRREFTKRAGYTILAVLAFKSKTLTTDEIAAFLPVIEAGAADDETSLRKPSTGRCGRSASAIPFLICKPSPVPSDCWRMTRKVRTGSPATRSENSPAITCSADSRLGNEWRWRSKETTQPFNPCPSVPICLAGQDQ